MSNHINDQIIDSYLDFEYGEEEYFEMHPEAITERAEFIRDILREDGVYTPATHRQTA